MKILINETYKNQEGGNVYLSAEQEKAKKSADTMAILDATLRYGQYANGAEILQAMEIKGKLKLEENYIKLEDADFEFVKTRANQNQALLQAGLTFAPFFEALENPLKEKDMELERKPENKVQEGETANSNGKEIK